MIPSNGCFSVGRATREKRTRAGRTDRSAQRERGSFDVFANFAAQWMTKPSPSSMRLPNFTSKGSRPDELCKTSTFTRRPGTRAS
jgi:hypothetical protein